MGKFNQEKHEAMRAWAAQFGCEDPETLVIRTESGVQFKGPGALKSYNRIKKMYREYTKENANASA